MNKSTGDLIRKSAFVLFV